MATIKQIQERLRGGGTNLPETEASPPERAAPQPATRRDNVGTPGEAQHKELAQVHAPPGSEDEEKKEPESEAWSLKEGQDVPPDYNDPVYDWRRETKRGRKSRRNFNLYVSGRLRAGEALDL